MPVRTEQQAKDAMAVGELIVKVVQDVWFLLPGNEHGWVEVKHPEMLEEIHWELTGLRGRLRLAIKGERDAL